MRIRCEITGRAIKAQTPLERFAEKCAFDPYTGCVMWIGTQTHGRGHGEPYGYFWNGERMELAHRWAAVNLHGKDIDGYQVDHCCPCGPSTLCVEHVEPETPEVNRMLQHTRHGRAFQDLGTRQHWLYVQKGIWEDAPRPERVPADHPYYEPPEWLRPFLTNYDPQEIDDGVPF